MRPRGRGFVTGIVFGVLGSVLAAGNHGELAVAYQPEPARSEPRGNEELARLFEEDQNDRIPGSGRAIDPEFVVTRDKTREGRVKALYEAGDLRTGKDYYRAAMILQHATKPEDYLLAHEFCIVALSKGEPSARWLAAATEDRFLMKLERPQRFGTQYFSPNSNEPFKLHEVGPGVTDGLRKELGVPTLDEALKRESEMGALFKIKKP